MTKLKTSLCDVLGIEHPIIQAGMGWDSRGSTTPPKLVAAVSNAGGLGVIGGSPLQPEFIRERIRATRELTDRPFGVDITLPRLAQTPFADVGNVREFLERTHPDHVSFVHEAIEEFGLETQGPDPWSKVKTPDMVQRQLDVILEEGVQVLAVGLGDTAQVVPLAHDRGMKVLALCGNVKQAVGHAANGVDVVIAQGYEAGGHTGRIANFPLIPQVVDAVRPTPVVVAGGIADGRGLAAALSLGAVGVWCGTVFPGQRGKRDPRRLQEPAHPGAHRGLRARPLPQRQAQPPLPQPGDPQVGGVGPAGPGDAVPGSAQRSVPGGRGERRPGGHDERSGRTDRRIAGRAGRAARRRDRGGHGPAGRGGLEEGGFPGGG